jgi:hypothetical protein
VTEAGSTAGRVELRQATTNVLALPIFIAVSLLAIIVSNLAAQRLTMALVGVCVAAALLDALFARYLLRRIGSTLVVTPDAITFIKKGPATPTVITRSANTTLSFRMAANGPRGMDYTGYALKLRDNATGSEVYAGAWGRRRVQQACESQGWTFS